MKKIMKLFTVIVLLFINILNVSAYKSDNDYVYFPGGGYANNDLYTAGGLININILSDDNFFDFTLYKTLFGNDIYIYNGEYGEYKPALKKNRKEHEKLFQAIFDREYNGQKIINNPDNRQEYLERKAKLDKEVELAELRYEKVSDAKKDTKEIEKRLIPVLKVYFKNIDNKSSDLRFESENICGQSLHTKIYFNLERSEFKDIKKYYLFAVNKNNSNAAPWGKNKSHARIIVTEKDLLDLNKEMFFFQEVDANSIIKKYKVAYWVPKEAQYNKYLTQKEEDKYHKYRDEDFLNVDFHIDYSDLVNYYESVGVKEHQKMSFSLLGVDSDGDVQVLSYDTENISIEVSENVSLVDIRQTCENFRKEPEYRLLSTKVGKLFKKLDTKYGLDNLESRDNSESMYSDVIHFDDENRSISHISVTYSEKEKLEKYKKILENLYAQLNEYMDKLDNQINGIVSGDVLIALSQKKKIEKLANMRSILKVISSNIQLSAPTPIGQEPIFIGGKMGTIDRFILKYEHEKNIKPSPVVYSCEINPEQCIQNQIGELEQVSEDEVVRDLERGKNEYIDQYGASGEDIEKYLISIYYGELHNKNYERAFNYKYKPGYNLEHFKNIYSDIRSVSKIVNIIKIKDFYKFKVTLTDHQGIEETYLVNTQIIGGKIKTLSSTKIK